METATYRDRFASDGYSVKGTLGPVGRAHTSSTEDTMHVRISENVEVVEGYYKGVRGRVTALYMDGNRVEVTYPHPDAGDGKVNPGHEVRCDVYSSQLRRA